MNRLGMMVDISHVSDKTFWDALEVSCAPLIAPHSSCRSISKIPRNMTGEMIVALAKKGGGVQVNFDCESLSQKSADTVAHIDQIVKIAGIDAVGIAADYDGENLLRTMRAVEKPAKPQAIWLRE